MFCSATCPGLIFTQWLRLHHLQFDIYAFRSACALVVCFVESTNGPLSLGLVQPDWLRRTRKTRTWKTREVFAVVLPWWSQAILKRFQKRCQHCAQRVPKRSHYGSKMMPKRFHKWFQDGAQMIPKRCQDYAKTVPNTFILWHSIP